MNKEIKRIDDKVAQQLTMLEEHEQKIQDLHDKNMAKEIEGKNRKGVIESLEARLLNSQRIIEGSRIVMEMTTEWNEIKEIMDQTSGMVEGSKEDPDKFEKAMKKINKLFPEKAGDLVKKIKMRKRWLKLETPLRNDLINQIDFMRRIKKNSQKHLKRMRMTPNQRAAADNQSFAMKMRWGAF